MSKETNFVTHLECSLTGTKYEKNKIHGLSEEGKPLLVRYDLKKMGKKPATTVVQKALLAQSYKAHENLSLFKNSTFSNN